MLRNYYITFKDEGPLGMIVQNINGYAVVVRYVCTPSGETGAAVRLGVSLGSIILGVLGSNTNASFKKIIQQLCTPQRPIRLHFQRPAQLLQAVPSPLPLLLWHGAATLIQPENRSGLECTGKKTIVARSAVSLELLADPVVRFRVGLRWSALPHIVLQPAKISLPERFGPSGIPALIIQGSFTAEHDCTRILSLNYDPLNNQTQETEVQESRPRVGTSSFIAQPAVMNGNSANDSRQYPEEYLLLFEDIETRDTLRKLLITRMFPTEIALQSHGFVGPRVILEGQLQKWRRSFVTGQWVTFWFRLRSDGSLQWFLPDAHTTTALSSPETEHNSDSQSAQSKSGSSRWVAYPHRPRGGVCVSRSTVSTNTRKLQQLSRLNPRALRTMPVFCIEAENEVLVLRARNAFIRAKWVHAIVRDKSLQDALHGINQSHGASNNLSSSGTSTSPSQPELQGRSISSNFTSLTSPGAAASLRSAITIAAPLSGIDGSDTSVEALYRFELMRGNDNDDKSFLDKITSPLLMTLHGLPGTHSQLSPSNLRSPSSNVSFALTEPSHDQVAIVTQSQAVSPTVGHRRATTLATPVRLETPKFDQIHASSDVPSRRHIVQHHLELLFGKCNTPVELKALLQAALSTNTRTSLEEYAREPWRIFGDAAHVFQLVVTGSQELDSYLYIQQHLPPITSFDQLIQDRRRVLRDHRAKRVKIRNSLCSCQCKCPLSCEGIINKNHICFCGNRCRTNKCCSSNSQSWCNTILCCKCCHLCKTTRDQTSLPTSSLDFMHDDISSPNPSSSKRMRGVEATQVSHPDPDDRIATINGRSNTYLDAPHPNNTTVNDNVQVPDAASHIDEDSYTSSGSESESESEVDLSETFFVSRDDTRQTSKMASTSGFLRRHHFAQIAGLYLGPLCDIYGAGTVFDALVEDSVPTSFRVRAMLSPGDADLEPIKLCVETLTAEHLIAVAHNSFESREEMLRKLDHYQLRRLRGLQTSRRNAVIDALFKAWSDPANWVERFERVLTLEPFVRYVKAVEKSISTRHNGWEVLRESLELAPTEICVRVEEYMDLVLSLRVTRPVFEYTSVASPDIHLDKVTGGYGLFTYSTSTNPGQHGFIPHKKQTNSVGTALATVGLTSTLQVFDQSRRDSNDSLFMTEIPALLELPPILVGNVLMLLPDHPQLGVLLGESCRRLTTVPHSSRQKYSLNHSKSNSAAFSPDKDSHPGKGVNPSSSETLHVRTKQSIVQRRSYRGNSVRNEMGDIQNDDNDHKSVLSTSRSKRSRISTAYSKFKARFHRDRVDTETLNLISDSNSPNKSSSSPHHDFQGVIEGSNFIISGLGIGKRCLSHSTSINQSSKSSGKLEIESMVPDLLPVLLDLSRMSEASSSEISQLLQESSGHGIGNSSLQKTKRSKKTNSKKQTLQKHEDLPECDSLAEMSESPQIDSNEQHSSSSHSHEDADSVMSTSGNSSDISHDSTIHRKSVTEDESRIDSLDLDNRELLALTAEEREEEEKHHREVERSASLKPATAATKLLNTHASTIRLKGTAYITERNLFFQPNKSEVLVIPLRTVNHIEYCEVETSLHSATVPIKGVSDSGLHMDQCETRRIGIDSTTNGSGYEHSTILRSLFSTAQSIVNPSTKDMKMYHRKLWFEDVSKFTARLVSLQNRIRDALAEITQTLMKLPSEHRQNAFDIACAHIVHVRTTSQTNIRSRSASYDSNELANKRFLHQLRMEAARYGSLIEVIEKYLVTEDSFKHLNSLFEIVPITHTKDTTRDDENFPSNAQFNTNHTNSSTLKGNHQQHTDMNINLRTKQYKFRLCANAFMTIIPTVSPGFLGTFGETAITIPGMTNPNATLIFSRIKDVLLTRGEERVGGRRRVLYEILTELIASEKIARIHSVLASAYAAREGGRALVQSKHTKQTQKRTFNHATSFMNSGQISLTSTRQNSTTHNTNTQDKQVEEIKSIYSKLFSILPCMKFIRSFSRIHYGRILTLFGSFSVPFRQETDRWKEILQRDTEDDDMYSRRLNLFAALNLIRTRALLKATGRCVTSLLLCTQYEQQLAKLVSRQHTHTPQLETHLNTSSSPRQIQRSLDLANVSSPSQNHRSHDLMNPSSQQKHRSQLETHVNALNHTKPAKLNRSRSNQNSDSNNTFVSPTNSKTSSVFLDYSDSDYQDLLSSVRTSTGEIVTLDPIHALHEWVFTGVEGSVDSILVPNQEISHLIAHMSHRSQHELQPYQNRISQLWNAALNNMPALVRFLCEKEPVWLLDTTRYMCHASDIQIYREEQLSSLRSFRTARARQEIATFRDYFQRPFAIFRRICRYIIWWKSISVTFPIFILLLLLPWYDLMEYAFPLFLLVLSWILLAIGSTSSHIWRHVIHKFDHHRDDISHNKHWFVRVRDTVGKMQYRLHFVNEFVLKVHALVTWREPLYTKIFVVFIMALAFLILLVPMRYIFTAFVLHQFTRPLRPRGPGLFRLALRRFYQGLPVPSRAATIYMQPDRALLSVPMGTSVEILSAGERNHSTTHTSSFYRH